MIRNTVVGYPRIGEQRELKKALELFWNKEIDFKQLEEKATELKQRHWNYQKNSGIDLISINDFSYYDNVLDTSILLGAIPKRFKDLENEELYFAMARGNKNAVAMEMTKWFNTNYHYIVPELSIEDEYKLNSLKIKKEYQEAKQLGIKTKINLIGPLTYLSLAKRVDGKDSIELLNKIKPLYEELLKEISTYDDEVFVQIDEPIFATDKSAELLSLLKTTYDDFSQISSNIRIIVTTYFDHSNEATKVLVHTPIYGIGLDFVSGIENLKSLEIIEKSNKKLFAGVVNGRNIWKNNFEKTLQVLNNISNFIKKDNIVISTSCSLLHVPYSLKYEEKLDLEIKSWLSFANEKLEEVSILSKIFFNQSLNDADNNAIKKNKEIHENRKHSNKIHDLSTQNRIKENNKFSRNESFEERIKIQKDILQYPELTTTTIGSFPQTPEIRKARREYKNNLIDKDSYENKMKEYIDYSIEIQEEIGLDILVHGEPERNDMVEYFGEQLKGYGFSQNGWVQSYGSRCVKPPFIYGDISRPKAMTVEWLKYAQSKTSKVVKGMLTGPVTILNWSFVRDDKEKSEVALQIALAISDEIDDLQKNGIKIIQVDEAAFKEGYPLRDDKRVIYEKWALESFKLSVASADAKTQIHTHMCYSDFNDIIKTIENMDADVISIETARSGNKLLKIFAKVGYKQEVGPGVYDIHSPRIPSVEEIEKQIRLLLEVLPKKQLWINPDCGLKTRKWEEVIPSLKNMVKAVKKIRKEEG
ncbi:5-methyltetrahydropteroyltriglutamate--homocysteine S-methyltransferase [Poseidonibacter lekithochrous]|uniref:5-methyltetrahydropteroyltriglutamate-- homocysteine S-methyltransferase n=1 Tax=Poseidonibacter TaxID=2321187 RepID=UPI001C09CAE3|nr:MULTISPECIES: 5-methyltetrahydropteroyltriglutamate--homocysteine S-methyltransferase [Poseidonibacter]MBU3014612.1 5-methyltetrahydropteroyltriglutamate--homocysteine S-methyltransferase [Poseidonibacter lekithochrous]MDO6827910.1 5-methyltetrahydropteroyltriglutamate--homocysteine S-methyltransferase [Poseidonibacter sp. 1_MG-2023]